MGRFAPFHRKNEAAVKLLPVAVNTNAGLPASTVFGKMLDKTGVAGGGAVIVKGNEFEASPAGSTTRTVAVPGVARSDAGTVAVNCDVVTKLVGNAAPFHCTTESRLKFAPVAVSVNAGEPACAEFGEMLESVGGGFCARLNVAPPAKQREKRISATCLSAANSASFDWVNWLNFMNISPAFFHLFLLFTFERPLHLALAVLFAAFTSKPTANVCSG